MLTGWLSVDPMMDKYPGISPYSYCAWNPIRIIDPNGDTLFALNSRSQQDIRSIVEKKFRKRISFDNRGVASIDYSGMTAEEINEMNDDAGIRLLNDIIGVHQKILYESSHFFSVCNPDGISINGFMDTEKTGIMNVSKGGLDSENTLTHLPQTGYDGQVVISPPP